MTYEIKGLPMPVVICHLKENEAMICKSGAMSWMSPNMQLETLNGSLAELASSLIFGEVVFQNRYVSHEGEGMVAFASNQPGEILALDISPDAPMICRDGAFLAASEDVEMDDYAPEELNAGFFLGKAIELQKMSGSGTVFLAVDGCTVEYTLEAGQQMVVDPAHIAMVDANVKMSLREVEGLKNQLFSGERPFLIALTGPGRVILQTMPMPVFAKVINSADSGEEHEEQEEK